MRFKGDIIITDPCYIIKKDNYDDWDNCNYGEKMEILGIKNYICRDTIYGDWSCTVYDLNVQNKVLGEFCADSGMVAVFLLKEVLKYNPDFDYHIKKKYKYTTTLIKDFDGNVEFEVDKSNKLHVVGKGDVNFISYQTGF